MSKRHTQVQAEEPAEWAGLVSLYSLVRDFPVRILAITALAAAAGFGLASTSKQSFESSILVGLDDWQSHNPVVDGLGIPVGIGDTRDAYSILRSQEVLKLVVSGSDQGPEEFRQGLTTWIGEEGGLGRFESADGSGFLEGSLKGPAGTNLVVHFKDNSHVVIDQTASTFGSLLKKVGLGLGGKAQTVEFSTGEAISFEDCVLTVVPHGDLTGRTFRMQNLTEREAVDRLRSSIVLQIPGQRNGVVRATVRNSQEALSKRLATAVAGAFLHHESSRMQAQGQQVVDYLGSELVLRQGELSRMGTLIAEAQNNNPDLIDPVVVLDRLREEQRELNALYLETSRRGEDFERLMSGGPLGDTSLTTLRRIAADPQVGRWLDRIDELQNLLQGSQPPVDSPLLQNQIEQLHASETQVRTSKRYSELFDARLLAFLEGEPMALAALLDDNGQDLVQSKPMIELAVRPFRAAQARYSASLERYTRKHPTVFAAGLELEEKRDRLTAALRAHSSTLKENHGRALASHTALQSQVDRAPEAAQMRWKGGKAALWAKVRTALTAQHGHLVAVRERQEVELGVLSERILRIPFDQGAIEAPLVKRRALETKIEQLHAKREDAEVALAGLQPSARVLEPATKPNLRQPHLHRLGVLVGTLIGLLVSLASAQFSSQRRLRFECGESGLAAQLPHVDLPVLSRMIRACMDDNFGAAHPMRPNVTGPAFAALRRLRVQLNLLALRKQNTSLLGITSLVAELTEFGAEEEPTLRHQTNDLREGSSSHMPSLVTATIGALSIGHRLAHKTVLVVDANVFGNSMTAHLDLMGNRGLADCLTGEDPWQSNVVTIDPSQVDVLPLGQAIGEGDEMLAHADLKPMLREMQDHYDVVLVELPGVDEAPNLPNLTSGLGSILVVENARTPLDAVECARLLGPLRRSGTRLIGTFVALRGVLVAAVKAA